MDPEITIKLELKLSDVNKILSSLVKEPFSEVFELINLIKSEGDKQFEKQKIK